MMVMVRRWERKKKDRGGGEGRQVEGMKGWRLEGKQEAGREDSRRGGKIEGGNEKQGKGEGRKAVER